MKKFFRFILIIALAVGIFYGYKYLKDNGIVDTIKEKVSNSSNESNTNGSSNTSGNKNNNDEAKKQKESEEKLSKIPNSWKELFIRDYYYVHEYWSFFGSHNEKYHIINGVVYKLDGEEYKICDEKKTWSDIDYTLYYDEFTQEDVYHYFAKDIILNYGGELGNSQPTDIDIYVNDNNKITKIIEDQKISESLHYTRTFDFDYDEKIDE